MNGETDSTVEAGEADQDRKLTARIAHTALFLLFFFQLIAGFIDAVYAYGLLGTSLPVEMVMLLGMFSPALLLVRGVGTQRYLIPVLCWMIILCRLAEASTDTRTRMLATGLGVAACLVLLPLWLQDQGRGRDPQVGTVAGAGLMLALLLSVSLRTWGSGQDISLSPEFPVVGWALVLAAGGLTAHLSRCSGLRTPRSAQNTDHPTTSGKPAAVITLSLGLSAVLILSWFVFSAPHVLSRWTGVRYELILAILLPTSLLWIGLGVASRKHLRPKARWLLIWNATLALSLSGTALVNQQAFSTVPNAYPMSASQMAFVGWLLLFLSVISFPILVADLALLTQCLTELRPSLKQLGVGFSMASLFLVGLTLAQVFTTTYDYVPVVGPWFRDQFWLVHLIPGGVLFLAMLVATRPENRGSLQPFTAGAGRLTLASALGLSVLTGIGWLFVTARPKPPLEEARSLTILTYNIQQGYSEAGQHNFHGQLSLIQQHDPDLLGLQETDNARIAGGNNDVVRYLTDALDLYAYYGPKTVCGTFGVALLSKYPIESPQTHYLYSQGEQVAVIEAQITVKTQTFRVFVTHLGNGGPMIQQKQLLEILAGKENVIVLGDFNFRPDSAQYALTTHTLSDSWTRCWPEWMDDRGQRPTGKIDHIFTSPGIQVTGACFIESPASDHPAVATTASW